MNLPKPEDALHNNQMIKILAEIADTPILKEHLSFKGGTCAAMLEYIDRFSVDLDFDMDKKAPRAEIKKAFYQIFKKLDFVLDDESKKYIQFVLKYKNPVENQRKTLKIDINDDIPKNNKYENKYIGEIDRVFNCQTVETMFANKLIAFTARHERKNKIAGRDIYDIHQFFLHAYRYDEEIIKERTGKTPLEYFKTLLKFIDKHIDQPKLETDLNSLLSLGQFRLATKTLKQETLAALTNEINKLEKEHKQ